MSPFNLESALSGKPLITRDGKPAQIVCVLAGGQPAPLLVNVGYWGTRIIQSGSDTIPVFDCRLENNYMDGRHSPPHEHPLDLMMYESLVTRVVAENFFESLQRVAIIAGGDDDDDEDNDFE